MILQFKIISLLVFFISGSLISVAQRIDHIASFETIDYEKYIRFYYDNDFFTKTDYYYTQGIVLEYGNPALKNFILSKLLLNRGTDNRRYSIGVNLASYSPTSISSDDILYGDRPFAAIISFSTNSLTTLKEKTQRLSSSVTIGVIGPAAQGKEIQTGIHQWLKNIMPHGWQYQLKNDVIINYSASYEKKLPLGGDHFLLNATAAASIGTFTDKLSAGFNFMAGNFNDPYDLKPKRKKIQYYLYGQARTNIIGYDATLQGGLFTHNNPYTIASADITRVTLQADAGVVINFRKTWLSYSQSFLTKEFKPGRYHRWGGISLGVAF
ncbi:MAG: lipid A deacylase LpxR family protein [Ferruginibacter sp.]|nr:lipid A deacylase LpxR family protein [Ferruginibacter sp.]